MLRPSDTSAADYSRDVYTYDAASVASAAAPADAAFVASDIALGLKLYNHQY